MEFDLVIIEVNFCGGRQLIYMEFKRLCRYSIYIVSRIWKFVSIIYIDLFSMKIPSLIECDFGFIVNRVLNDIGSLTQLKTGCDFPS